MNAHDSDVGTPCDGQRIRERRECDKATVAPPLQVSTTLFCLAGRPAVGGAPLKRLMTLMVGTACDSQRPQERRYTSRQRPWAPLHELLQKTLHRCREATTLHALALSQCYPSRPRRSMLWYSAQCYPSRRRRLHALAPPEALSITPGLGGAGVDRFLEYLPVRKGTGPGRKP